MANQIRMSHVKFIPKSNRIHVNFIPTCIKYTFELNIIYILVLHVCLHQLQNCRNVVL